MHPESTTVIAVIVPLLNERDSLETLFATLAAQQGVTLELILCDGGSRDGTAAEAERLANHAPFPVRVVKTGTGRGLQMNAGRRLTAAPLLLFLHADCRFVDSDALTRGAEQLAAAGTKKAAGRFGLRFDRKEPTLHFHELKARQNRPGCINGDQGWLMPASFFDEVGPFDETLPFFEDARLALRIAQEGRWLLFDREIVTSARRFDREGQRERRLLNALIMVCGHTGRDDFLASMPDIYRQQGEAERLSLAPFFRSYRQTVAALPATERKEHHQLLGEYLAANLWQLPLLFDAQREFKRGLPPGSGGTPVTCLLFPFLARIGKLRPVQGLLVFLWRLLAAFRS